MRTSETIKELATALVAMQKDLGMIAKSGENQFDKYTYANLEDYIAGTRVALKEHDFFLASSVENITQLEDRTTQKGGKEHAVQVKVAIRLIHKSGEWIEATAIGEGQDRADKAVYKAITGARKYGIASLLGLATSDDPEADEQVGHSQAPKAVSTKPADNNSFAINTALNGWVAKLKQQTSMDKLKDVYIEAVADMKAFATKEQLKKLEQAKDSKKSELMEVLAA